jgi:hypothetical protein
MNFAIIWQKIVSKVLYLYELFFGPLEGFGDFY